MSWFGRLDVILLALLFTYVFVVAIHVYWRYSLARTARGIASARRRALVAALNIELGGLKSIALTAPYLGLAGTCEGILSALGGGSMAHHAFVVMVATRMALAVALTATAIPVATLATCSYNFLRTRIDLLECEGFEEREQRGRHLREARRFPPAKRFSELPAFALVAVPALAIAIAGAMTFASLHTSKGFYVELASARCEPDVVDRLIVLHITGAGEVFLNLDRQDWNTLAGRLSEIYRMRKGRTLYLLADSDVSFQTVAYALDTAENAGIRVSLVTPKALNADCADRLKPRY